MAAHIFATVGLLLVFGATAATTYSGNCMVSTLSTTGAAFNLPVGLAAATGPSGNLYVADAGLGRVVQVSSSGFAVLLPAVFGQPPGVGPLDVAVSTGDTAPFYAAMPTEVFVIVGGVPRVLAGPATGFTGFRDLSGLALDLTRGILYASDFGAHVVWAIATNTGAVWRLAGGGGPCGGAGAIDGSAFNAALNEPFGIAISTDGAQLFVADYENNLIRVIATATGAVRTLAGNLTAASSTNTCTEDGQPSNIGTSDGVGASAAFSNPTAVAADGAGNVYVVDFTSSRIRLVTPQSVVTTLAGTTVPPPNVDPVNGAGDVATFFQPTGITINAAGAVIVADSGHAVVRVLMCPGVQASSTPSPTPTSSLTPSSTSSPTPTSSLTPSRSPSRSPAPAYPPAPAPPPAVAMGVFDNISVAAASGAVATIAIVALATGAISAYCCARRAAAAKSVGGPPSALELSNARIAQLSSISKVNLPNALPLQVGGMLNLPGAVGYDSGDGAGAPFRASLGGGGARVMLNPLKGAAGGAQEWGSTAPTTC